MPWISFRFAVIVALAALPLAGMAQQPIPPINGTNLGNEPTAAQERAVSAAIDQQVEYRARLQQDLTIREQFLRTSEAELEVRRNRLRETHRDLLLSAQKVQEQAAKLKSLETASPADRADSQAEDGNAPSDQTAADTLDPSVVKRLSKEFEEQTYAIQLATAQARQLRQEVEYLRGVIAHLSGRR